MSQAGCRMDEIQRALVLQDREKAMSALMEHIHYEIAPKIPREEGAVTTDIFRCQWDVDEFCRERGIMERAFAWLLKELRAANLLEKANMPITLSRNGVARFCRE